MSSNRRPLSPHLQIYRFQLTSVMSITHRMTGIFLCLGTIPLIYWLLALAGGPDAFATAIELLSHPLSLIVLAAWSWSLFYHLLNGIRHLCWDAGWLLELRGAYASGWVVVALSLVLTLVVWGVAL